MTQGSKFKELWSVKHKDGSAVAVSFAEDEPDTYRITVDRAGQSAQSAKVTLDELRGIISAAADHSNQSGV